MSLDKATITCYCKQISVPLSDLAKDTSFPIPVELCHCDTCRYSSGSLGATLLEFKAGPDESTLAKCTEYASSSKVSRYFCSTCGSHLFIRGFTPTDPVAWFGWAAPIRRNDDGKEDTVNVNMQAFVNDTIDGGLLGRMIEVAKQRGTQGEDMGEVLQCVYAGTFEGPTMSFAEMDEFVTKAKARDLPAPQQSDKLLAKCRCGGVQFHVTRPDQSKQYDEKVQYYLKQNNTKYFARICVCWDCCSPTGNPLHPWTYVPPDNIVTVDGSAIEFGAGENNLAQLPNVRKIKNGDAMHSFCKTCGATMFLEHVKRPWVINIATGIFRSDTGSLANDWLDWTFDEVSWMSKSRVEEYLKSVAGDSVKESP